MNEFTKEDKKETIRFFIKDELVCNCGKYLSADLVDKIADKIFSDIEALLNE